jgi:response regulator RpfG family c-di-GMP phosphodiesterase
MAYTERVLVVFNPDSSVKGVAAYDETGYPQPIKEGDLEGLFPSSSLLAENEALKTQAKEASAKLAEVTAERDSLLAEKKETEESAKNSVSPVQAKVALAQAGLLDKVEEFITSLPNTSPARISWNNALEWRRDSQFIKVIGEKMGLSEGDVDGLFASARGVKL